MFGKTADLKSFDDIPVQIDSSGHIKVGLRSVSLAKVVGSVGRHTNFTSKFMPRGLRKSWRYRKIVRAYKDGVPMPPVHLYEVLGEYFVVDGHHRVAAALETGGVDIDADVEVFIPFDDSPAKWLSLERARFEITTGLHDIELSEPGSYQWILDEIEEHKWLMSERAGRNVGIRSAALDWHQRVYSRVVVNFYMKGRPRESTALTPAQQYLEFQTAKWLDSEKEGHDVGVSGKLDRFFDGRKTGLAGAIYRAAEVLSWNPGEAAARFAGYLKIAAEVGASSRCRVASIWRR